MKKRITTIIISLLFVNVLFSQNFYTEKIKWKENITLQNENENLENFLHFENAVVENNSFLPYFSKTINLNYTKNSEFTYSVQLKNKVFETFSKKEISEIKYLKNIGTKIEIKSAEYNSRNNLLLQFSFIPIRKNLITNSYEKLISFDFEIIKTSTNRKTKTKGTNYVNHSILSTGNWFKIAINKTGVYKLSFDQLRAMGISNPEKVRVFGNGEGLLPTMNEPKRIDDLKELKINKRASEIVFYAKGSTRWDYDEASEIFLSTLHKFSNYSYYFLSSDYNTGFDNQISSLTKITENENETVSTYINYYSHEREMVNLLESGSTWYGEEFYFQLEYDFNLNFPNIVSGSEVKFKTSLLARASLASSFSLEIDNENLSVFIPAVSTYSSADYAQSRTQIQTFNSSGDSNFNLNIKYNKPTASAKAWLNYFVLNAECQLIMSGTQMPFRYVNTDKIEKVSLFNLGGTSQSINIWNVSDLHNISSIDFDFNGGVASFKQKNSENIEFIAFAEDSYLTPIIEGSGLGLIENQDLHGLPQTDYIIITHPDFYSQAQELKNYYEQTTDLHVSLLKPEQIYNEFSSGAVDVSALRDFVRMFYKRAETQGKYPRYLLLFGNGSYNNVGYAEPNLTETSNTNFILTYQSENSLGLTNSFVSDDFFGLLDDNEGDYFGLLDIGIGRFPVENAEQADLLVEKTKRYNSSSAYGLWQNQLTFAADDGDANTHLNDSERLSTKVRGMHPEYNISKFYVDAFQKESTSGGESVEDLNIGLDGAVNKGTLIFNYSGHGNQSTLTSEKIVNVNSIRAWNNYNHLAVVMTATCEFSRFDNWNQVTAGEEILLNPQGGAIAMFSTTRAVYAYQNYILNNKFYDYIFEKDAKNEQYRMGEVMQMTKIYSGSSTNKRNFTLLGDPAIQIAIPKYNIRTTSVNGNAIGIDTLKAASEITIMGEIVDESNQKIPSLSGTLFVTVYDKFTTQQTLGQGDNFAVNFELQKSILYNGSASLVNGDFSFSFIVPKDIAYKVGKGKLSYYASFSNTSAAGYNNQIEIGDFSDNPISSKGDIQLELFMNDSSFISGGITNETPKLIAYINSNTGINTVGNGIGHDVSAILDGNTKNNILLNDFYQAEKDTYKKGKIEYLFSKIESGNHTLSLKVWDVLNNSTTEEIEFLVIEEKELTIEKLFNYPNPFTNNTWFYFTHNQSNSDLEILIQIYTVSGKLIKTIERLINVDSYLSERIFWDGFDDFGDKIGRGVYFYKLKIRNEQGKDIEKIEKLLILK